jgi:hypothetical protein
MVPMKRSSRSRLATCSIVAVAAATLLAACGDDDDAATTTEGAATTEATTATSEPASTASSEDTSGTSEASTPGGGSASDNKDDYASALVANIGLDDEEIATCIATAVVDEIGFDRIQGTGLSPDEFANGESLDEMGLTMDPEQADHLKAAFVDCGDIAEAFIAAESGSEEQKACERGLLTNDIAAEVLANQLTGAENSTELDSTLEKVQACASETTGSGAVTSTTG